MKSKFLVLIVISVFCLFNPHASAINEEGAPSRYFEITSTLPQGATKIELHGDLFIDRDPDVVEAGVYQDAVYIEFNQSLGNVSIYLYSDSGLLLYQTIVNTNVQHVVIIPLNDYANPSNSSFYLVIDNANGSAEGSF